MQTTVDTIRLLIVDDDEKFCRLISEYLSRFGYEVHSVHTGDEGVRVALEKNWNVIVLDVMLPGMDGYKVLQKLRESIPTPILMLTALGEETDRIVGLELGADDYVPKTSSPRELLARLRAVMRRFARVPLDVEPADELLIVGPIQINLASRVVTLADSVILFTPVEFDLLVVLAQAKGRIKSREELINEIRDRHYDVFDRSIDVHISAIRRKLGDDPKNPAFIKTVRSAGYMLINVNEKA